jgi:hypothetical protein
MTGAGGSGVGGCTARSSTLREQRGRMSRRWRYVLVEVDLLREGRRGVSVDACVVVEGVEKRV